MINIPNWLHSLSRNETNEPPLPLCFGNVYIFCLILHHWFWIRGSLLFVCFFISQNIWAAAGYRRPTNCMLRKLFTTSNAEGSETAVSPLDAHWEGCVCVTALPCPTLDDYSPWWRELHSTDFKKYNSSSMWPRWCILGCLLNGEERGAWISFPRASLLMQTCNKFCLRHTRGIRGWCRNRESCRLQQESALIYLLKGTGVPIVRLSCS